MFLVKFFRIFLNESDDLLFALPFLRRGNKIMRRFFYKFLCGLQELGYVGFYSAPRELVRFGKGQHNRHLILGTPKDKLKVDLLRGQPAVNKNKIGRASCRERV